MEEKKQIKISLGTVFLVTAIILIVVMGALLYIQKTEADRQIAELENNANKLQETIDDLQGKIDTISNTINSNTRGEIDNSQSNNTVQNAQENVNKCYTDGKYYWLMLYTTNLNNVSDSKTSPAKEQRTFSLIVNSGDGQQYLYGWYDIENEKITLRVGNQANYNYINNTANMMTQGSDVEVKENGGQYIITLDYTQKVIKYGPYDLIENNQENVNKCYTDGKYYWLMLYKTNLNNVPDSKASPAKEQRIFSLMANSGYGQEHLYGWYNIENDKITLRVEKQDNYNYVNNIVNMMTTQGNNLDIKEDGGQYIITLDYTEKVIKYGPYDLKVQSN